MAAKRKGSEAWIRLHPPDVRGPSQGEYGGMFNQLTRRKEIPASPRPAADPTGPPRRRGRARAAGRSSTPATVPRGDVLLAEVGEELWAALSLDDGHAVADPLRPSADAVLILGRARLASCAATSAAGRTAGRACALPDNSRARTLA